MDQRRRHRARGIVEIDQTGNALRQVVLEPFGQVWSQKNTPPNTAVRFVRKVTEMALMKGLQPKPTTSHHVLGRQLRLPQHELRRSLGKVRQVRRVSVLGQKAANIAP